MVPYLKKNKLKTIVTEVIEVRILDFGVTISPTYNSFSEIYIRQGNAWSSDKFWKMIQPITLPGSQRSGDNRLLELLGTLGDSYPTERVRLELNQELMMAEEFSPGIIEELYGGDGGHKVTVLTVTNKGQEDVNDMVLAYFSNRVQDVQIAPVWTANHKDVGYLRLFPGARIMITLNKNISRGLINGQIAVILAILERSLILQLADHDEPVSLPLTRQRINGHFYEAFSVAGGYAMTIHKSQGLTIAKVVIYWNSARCQGGLAYTALSRARSLKDIRFIGDAQRSCYKPNNA